MNSTQTVSRVILFPLNVFKREALPLLMVVGMLAFLPAAGAQTPPLNGDALLNSGRAVFKPDLRNVASIPLHWRLDQLTSAAGQPEVYKTLKDYASAGIEVKPEIKRLGNSAVEIALTFTNKGADRQMLRSVLDATIPFAKYDWWNGYANTTPGQFDPQDVFLSKWFPLNAALADGMGIGNGVNPMDVYSRIDSTRIEEGGAAALSVALPFVLDPGQSFTLSHVVTAFPVHFGYRDAIQNYYDLFPRAYQPADNIDPRVISAELAYLAWKPQNYGLTDPADMIRRFTGGQGGWEWCYGDAARMGNWANTDQWIVGWNNSFPTGSRRGRWTAQRLEKFRKGVKEHLAQILTYDAAPMYYVNVMYAEKDLIESHFPKVLFDRTPHKSQGQFALTSVYPGWNGYGKLFWQGLTDIAKEYPSARGVGFDSVFGHRVIGDEVDGVVQTPRRSFEKGKIIAIEGAGDAKLLDVNHSHQIDGVRAANAVNYKLVSPYFIGARTDAALYEGTPMARPDRFNRVEAMRARLGSRKTLSWHKHLLPQRIAWVQWDRLDPDKMRQVYRQIQVDQLLLCYLWGATPSPMMPAMGVERTFKAIPELIQLTKLGWQPSPLVHVKGGVVPVRYGQGLGANVVLINPAYEDRPITIQLNAEDWDGHLPILAPFHGGNLTCTLESASGGSTRVRLTVPARDVVRLWVVGRLKADRKLTGPLTIRTDRSRGEDGQEVCEFQLTGTDQIPLEFELAGDASNPVSQLTLLGRKTAVKQAKPLQFRLDAKDWTLDFQSSDENVRHARFYLDQYAPVQVQLNDEELRKMNLVDSLKDPSHAVAIVYKGKGAWGQASRLAQWFKTCTAYAGKEMSPQVVEEAQASKDHPAILLAIQGDLSLKHDGVAVVRAAQTGGIEITAQSPDALRQAVTSLMLKLDQAYPYVGKLTDRDPYLKAMGLAGGVLKETTKKPARQLVGPTLEARLEKIGLMSGK